jgi:predicted phage terminase large subunit-like protein
VAAGGDIFRREWFNLVPTLPDLREVYLVVDTAISEKTTADFSVIMTGGVGVDGDCYITHVARDRWNPVDLRAQLLAGWARALQQYGHRLRGILLEDTKEAQVLRSWIKVDAPQCPVIMQPHGGVDKVTRASRVVPMCEARRVKFLHAPWTEPLLAELESFSAAGAHLHDDQVDCLVYLVARTLGLVSGGARGMVVLNRGFV